MTKLRDDVRGAFDQEQSALRDVGDARHRLVHNALAAREVPASHGLQLAAGIAAVLIAAIVIATFALARAANHSQVVPATTPTPKAIVSPTPLKNLLSVPESTPLLIYSDPADAGQSDGITWDGKSSGRLPYQAVRGTANPAGNLFGQANAIVDRLGTVVGTGTFGAKSWQATWADDETHFCLISPFDNPGTTGIPTTLEVGAPGQALKDIARVGTLYNQTSVSVLACSVLADRAVVFQSGGQGIGVDQYWLLQLSTGRIIWTHSFNVTNAPADVVVARDGMYVAELLPSGTASGSNVYGPDGKQVAHLPSWVRSFSWDDSAALLDPGPGAAQLVSWRNGSVMWSEPAGYLAFHELAEPGGASMAILVLPEHGSTYGDLYVLDASGSVLVHIVNTYLNF